MADLQLSELVELTLDIGDPERSPPFYTEMLGMEVCLNGFRNRDNA